MSVQNGNDDVRNGIGEEKTESVSHEEKDTTENGEAVNTLIDSSIEKEPKYNPKVAEEIVNITTTPASEKVSDNETFNPAIHESNPDGSPRLTADGKYRKKRGRKSNETPKANPSTENKTNQSVGNDEEKCRMFAKVCVQTISMVLQATIDKEEWTLSRDESEILEKTWGDYFIMVGIIEMPPWVMPTVVTGSIVLQKCKQPKTKEKLLEMKNLISNKGVNAQSDTRVK